MMPSVAVRDVHHRTAGRNPPQPPALWQPLTSLPFIPYLRDSLRRPHPMPALVDIVQSPPPVADGELELTVVMPCLNEERTLPGCIAKALNTMREHGIAGEVLIVDNGSTDRSVVVAREHGARVVHQPVKGY